MRPTFYKADLGIGVRLHDLKDEFCMFVMVYEPYVKNDTNAHVTISSWKRIDDNVIPARGKVAGAYANSALIKTDAARAGFDEALVLDNNGHISEGSAMNIFMLRDGILITPPVTDNILEGITRRSIIDCGNELGLDVVERSIDAPRPSSAMRCSRPHCAPVAVTRSTMSAGGCKAGRPNDDMYEDTMGKTKIRTLECCEATTVGYAAVLWLRRIFRFFLNVQGLS
jgi:hypothetical protein